MRIRHINKTVFDKNYSTDNIIEVVMWAYENETDSQITELARTLRGANDTETCRNVWQYLIDKVQYIADGVNQDIKTPARLIHDGTGDCKSYSLFTACILRELGIKHFFRFVSYDKRKEATHVYVVAIIDNKELPIDAVAFVQARCRFGNEIKNTYRADMSEIGKIRYLAGVNGNASMGDTIPTPEAIKDYLNSEAFQVWLGEESEGSLTMAKGYLLSEWDKFWTVAAYVRSESQFVEALNNLQYIGAMLRAYNELRHDNEQLQRAGRVFSHLMNARAFDNPEAGTQTRDFFSDKQNDTVMFLLASADELPENDFTATWNELVVANNTPYRINGKFASIGAVQDIRTSLKQTGGYYIYNYGIPSTDITKYSTAVRSKRSTQQMIMNRNTAVINTLSTAETQNLAYSGCTETFGATPAQAISDLKNGKINGTTRIGAPVTMAFILGTISTIIGLVGDIIGWFKKSEVPSNTTIQGGVFSPNDFPSSSGGSGNSGGSGGSASVLPGSLTEAGMSWVLPMLLIGGALFMTQKPKGKGKKKN